jgi:putative ABC transport system permease protein
MNDLKFAFRQLLKNPGFTVVAVLTLALGIGANTAIFAQINELLLLPLPVKDPSNLLGVVLVDQTGDFASQNMPYPIYQDYREQSAGVFKSLAAYATVFTPAEIAAEPRFAVAQLASADYFSTLGVVPALGRFFLADDDRAAEQSPVVVLSHACWRNWFNADPAVIGKTLVLRPAYVEPLTCTIVGVAPTNFSGLEQPGPQFWIPAVMEEHFKRAMSVNFRMVGRLTPGMTRRHAATAMDVVVAAVSMKHGGKVIPGYENEGIFRSDLRTELRQAALGTWGAFRPVATLRKARRLALGAAGLVLLIACANIANLLLARAERRRKENAIRLSLGASRTRILRLLLTESLLLSLFGGAVGLLVAQWSNHLLMTLKPGDVDLLVSTRIDLRATSFSFLIALISGLVIGSIPAWRGSRQDPNLALKGQAGGGPAHGLRLNDWFASAQIALSLVLLIAAGLCLRSFANLLSLNPGFDTQNLVVAPVDFHGVPEATAPAHYHDLVQRLTAVPGIKSVSWTRGFPLLGGGGMSVPVDEIQGYEPKRDEFLSVEFTQTGPRYFETVGMRVAVAPNRPLRSQDSLVWVNQAFVRRYWPGQNPVGRRVGHWLVEGVVEDSQIRNLWDKPGPYLFLQQADPNAASGVLMIRTSGNPSAAVKSIRAELQGMDPQIDLSRMKTMRQVIGKSLASQEFMLALLSGFAACALALAIIGIYGVISYLVTQRTRDIGIRIALGAQRMNVAVWVMRQGLALTLLGLALGLAGSWAATRLLASALFGISPTDPTTFVAVSTLLAGAACLACWLPARRATKVDPMKALRCE